MTAEQKIVLGKQIKAHIALKVKEGISEHTKAQDIMIEEIFSTKKNDEIPPKIEETETKLDLTTFMKDIGI